MTAANQIIIPGASHTSAIVGEMGYENTAPPKFQFCILPMIVEQSARLCRQVMHRHLVANIVAMYYMQRYAKLKGRTQGIRSDKVATMDDNLRPSLLRFCNSRCKRF